MKQLFRVLTVLALAFLLTIPSSLVAAAPPEGDAWGYGVFYPETGDPNTSGSQAKFDFSVQRVGLTSSGDLTIKFKLGNAKFKSKEVSSVEVNANMVDFSGTGTLDGKRGYSFIAHAEDSDVDSLSFTIYNSAGTIIIQGYAYLGQGNITVIPK